MAKWTGIKASSAATLYRGAKRKLNKYMDGTTTSTTMPAKAVPAPKRAKKSTAKTAKGVAKAEEEEIVEYPAAIIKKAASDHPVLARQQAVIERQVRHLARLVDDLLDVSRITRGTVSLRQDRADLRQIVQGAVEACRGMLDERGHTLTVDLPASPAFAIGATDHLRLTLRLPESSPSTAQSTSGTLTLAVLGVQAPGKHR